MNFIVPAFTFLLLAAPGANAATLRGNNDVASLSHRGLQQQQHVDGIDDFVSLSCNSGIQNVSCRSWSSVFGSSAVYNSRMIVPCGQCITMDRKGSLQFNGGLDVLGKLVFPENSSIEIISPIVAVQGLLTMSSTKPVDGQSAIKFTMIGNNTDMTFEPVGENMNNCKGAKTCATGKKSIVVAGGQVDINGLPPNTPTWVRLHDVAGNSTKMPTSIIIANSIKNKWIKGAQILITSHTRVWNESQVRNIVSVSDAETGYVRVELDKPIIRPTTIKESPDFAVEVALLSRNILFQGGSDNIASHGGHFMVFHTPSVIQSIVGVEVRNFGQQGNLGRYPIHFHFCGDVPGSKIAKNSVVQSNQRCVVVHGTNKLLIEENIAYDTKGHCFITEDGMETANKFIRNLGAQTGVPLKIIPNYGTNGNETDDEPSTFWVAGPGQYWEGNVAAGSASSGFWIEPKLRGDRKSEFEKLIDPQKTPMLSFKDNVVHSCGNLGGLGAVRMYQPGYFPTSETTMDGLKSYRNDEKGIVIHRNTNMVFINGLFADNHIGIDLDRATDIEIRNTRIIGESDSYKQLMARQQVANVGRADRIYAIDLHTWKTEDWGAFYLDNITISGFDNVKPSTSKIIHMDDHNLKGGQFEMYTAFSNIKIQGNNRQIDFCTIEKAGINTAYLIDLKGDLSPATFPINMTGTLLSNGENMLKFIDTQRCTTMQEGCYTYCRDTCFRSVRFTTEQSNMTGHRLKVCERGNPSKCSFFLGLTRGGARDPRTFVAHLRAGKKYDAVFLNPSGQEVAPSGNDFRFEESFCSPSMVFEVAFKFGPTMVHKVT